MSLMQLSHTSCIRLRNVPTYGETFSLFNSSAIIPAFSSRIPRISTGSVFIRGWVQYTRKQRQMVKLMSELQRLKRKRAGRTTACYSCCTPCKIPETALHLHSVRYTLLQKPSPFLFPPHMA